MPVPVNSVLQMYVQCYKYFGHDSQYFEDTEKITWNQYHDSWQD